LILPKRFPLNRNGYEVIRDISPSQVNTIIAARKTAQPTKFFSEEVSYEDFYKKKFTGGLALAQLNIKRKCFWHWEARNKTGGGDVAWMARQSSNSHYVFGVEPLTRRYTNLSDSLLKFSFAAR